MTFVGLHKPQGRADLIAYLAPLNVAEVLDVRQLFNDELIVIQ